MLANPHKYFRTGMGLLHNCLNLEKKKGFTRFNTEVISAAQIFPFTSEIFYWHKFLSLEMKNSFFKFEIFRTETGLLQNCVYITEGNGLHDSIQKSFCDSNFSGDF